MSYADFLDCVLTEEVLSKTAKNVTMRTHLARFPFVKGLEVFDFAYQPSLDKKQVQQLASSTCGMTCAAAASRVRRGPVVERGWENTDT